MIGVTATAVGLNMTFLLPYSMISRGWDKNFRGFARWELITAMAIPYILVTTCIVMLPLTRFTTKLMITFFPTTRHRFRKAIFWRWPVMF